MDLTGRRPGGPDRPGLSRVGIYVPGGTAAYPSSVLMNAIPAKVAGVEEIVMVTPPTENLNAAVLAAPASPAWTGALQWAAPRRWPALTYGAGFIPRWTNWWGLATPMWPPPNA